MFNKPWSLFTGFIFFSLLALLGCKEEAAWTGQPKLPTRQLSIGKQQIMVEIADTAQTMSLGLMHRKSLKENEGMLFVFPEKRQVSFWMKDTQLPLSIAYLDSVGNILEIYDMEPYSETLVPSQSYEILFALEMNQGWFAKRGIQIGQKVQGLP